MPSIKPHMRKQHVRRIMKDLKVGQYAWIPMEDLYLVEHAKNLEQRRGKQFQVRQHQVDTLVVQRTR